MQDEDWRKDVFKHAAIEEYGAEKGQELIDRYSLVEANQEVLNDKTSSSQGYELDAKEKT